MNIHKIRFAVLFAFVFFAGVSSSVAHASMPVVTSFSASPQSVSYGHTTLLSWTIDNGGGASLYFTCPSGVVIKKDDGTVFPCNTKQTVSTSASASDSAAFSITNFTGNLIVLPVRIIPKDSSGTDYGTAAVTTNLFVGQLPYPITDFSYATLTKGTSTVPITLTWTGLEVPGANLQFDCKDGVQVYSTSPSQALPITCGAVAYTSDLPASGSASVYFVNANSYPVDETIRIFPAMSAGVYDATHAKFVTFTIPPKPAPTLPSVAGFTSAQTLLASGQSTTFSWVGNNTPGVNFQIPCQSSVSWSSTIASTTTALACDKPAFSNALPSMGTTTLAFTNNTTSVQPVTVSIFPQNFDGTYDATRGLTVGLRVLEPGHVEIPVPGTTLVVANQSGGAGAAAQTNTATGLKVVRTVTFSLNLRLGSRSAQVGALQSFLKQDSSLYPEGLVTGYMGPATVSALKRFQIRYGVAKQGDAGYGEVGPKTRAKLNTIQTF